MHLRSHNLFFVALAFAAIAESQAVEKTWNFAGTGGWTQGSLWTPSGVPGALDYAYIANGGTAWLIFGTTNISRLYLGGSGGSGTLRWDDFHDFNTSGSSFIGNAGGSGSVLMNFGGGRWDSAQDIIVGASGTGLLEIKRGADVTSTFSFLGDNAGITGTVNVDGSGSTWTQTGGLVVGRNGTGNLSVTNSASVTNFESYIGGNAGSTGTVTVTSNGQWTNNSFIRIGDSGTGRLNISGGGIVSAGAGTGTVTIGLNSGSSGTLNIGAAVGQTAIAPGTLQAATVTGGAGTALVNFNHTEDFEDEDVYVFAPSLTGNLAVQHNAGWTFLTGTNTYTGGTTINGGTLVVGNVGSTGTISGNVTLANGGTLAFARDSYTYAGNVTGTGTILQIGDWDEGYLVLTGNNSGPGVQTEIWGGTLGIGSNTALGGGKLTIYGGGIRAHGAPRTISNEIEIAGGFTLGRLTDLTGPITLTSGATITSANPDAGAAGSVTISGLINSGGQDHGLAFDEGENGIGEIILTADNTYGGFTWIFGGKVTVASAAKLGSASAQLNFSGGTLKTTGAFNAPNREAWVLGNFTIESGGFDTTFSSLTGDADLTRVGAGNLTIRNGGYLGGMLSNTAGTLVIGTNDTGNTATFRVGNYDDDSGVTGPIVVNSGDTLEFALGESANRTIANTISGAGGLKNTFYDIALTGGVSFNGPITVDSQKLTLAPSNVFRPTTLVKNGNGALVITGTVDPVTSVTVNGGTLQLGDGGTTGILDSNLTAATVSLATGTKLVVNRSDSTEVVIANAITGTGGVTNDGSAAVLFSDVYTRHSFNGPITANGGTMTFATYTGSTLTKRGSGTAIIRNSGGGSTIAPDGIEIEEGTLQLGFGATPAGATNIGYGATLAIAQSGTYSGAISGPGELRYVYSGNSAILTGALSFGGPITVSEPDGELEIRAPYHVAQLHKYGAGDLKLRGAVTTDVGTIIHAGELTISSNSGYNGSLTGPIEVGIGTTLELDAVSYTGEIYGTGTLNIVGGATINGLIGGFTGTTTLNSDLVLNTSGFLNTAITSSYSGPDWEKAGPGTLFVTKDTSTRVSVTGGIVSFGIGGATGMTTAGSLAIGPGTEAWVNIDHTVSLSTISGTGLLRNFGPGTLVIPLTNSSTSFTGTLDTHYTTRTELEYSGSPRSFSPVAISGGGVLAKTGTGQLTLGTNDYSGFFGTLAIEGGRLVLTTGSAASDYTLDGDINGVGNLEIRATSKTITFTGDATHTGGTLISNGTLQIGNGLHAGTIGGNINISGGSLAFNLPSASTFSNAITGGGTVVQNGPADVTLNGALSYTGHTYVNGAGRLIFQSPFGAGSQMRKYGNGTMVIDTDLAPSQLRVGAGTVQLGNGGTTGTLTGDIIFETQQSVFAVNRSSDVTISGYIEGQFLADFIVRGTGDVILSGGIYDEIEVTIQSGRLVVDRGAAPSYFGSPLHGSGDLVKRGSGTLNLGISRHGGGDFTGALVIEAGTVNSPSAVLTLDTPFEVGAAGTLNFTGSGFRTAGSLAGAGVVNVGQLSLYFGRNNTSTTFSGTLNGDSNFGELVKEGAGTFTASGAIHTGLFTVSAGALKLGANNVLDAAVELNVGGLASFQLDQYAQTVADIYGGGVVNTGTSGALTLNVTRTNASFSNPTTGTGTFTKTGTLPLSIYTTTTLGHTGLTTVAEGVLSARIDQFSGPISVSSGATLQLTGNGSINRVLSGAGLVKVFANSGNYTVLTAPNMPNGVLQAYTGPLVLGNVGNDLLANLGTLDIAGTGSFVMFGRSTSVGMITGAGTINMGGGGLTVTGDGDGTFSGSFANSGTLAKDGDGTLTLTGYNATSGGQFLVSGGALKVNSDFRASSIRVEGGRLSGSGTVGFVTIASGGKISPGNSPGVLNTGAEEWQAGGGYVWEINSAPGAQGSNYDRLNIAGELTISATSEIRFTIFVTSLTGGNAPGYLAGFNPFINYDWVIATANDVSGFNENKFRIDTSGFFNAPGSTQFSVLNVGHNLVLHYAAVPEPEAWGAMLGLGLGVLAMLRRRRVCRG